MLCRSFEKFIWLLEQVPVRGHQFYSPADESCGLRGFIVSALNKLLSFARGRRVFFARIIYGLTEQAYG